MKLHIAWVSTLLWAWLASVTASAGEVLYNGIALPDEWPPRIERLTRQPMPVPYLEHPPEVIPIDVGRQLLVDNFLVEKTTLHRKYHRAEFHPANPVVKPDKPWEHRGEHPTAMVFSDGVWYDTADRLFKMWYMGGYGEATCYAFSEDGIHWTKPSLDVVEPGTNIVQKLARDPRVAWRDQPRDSSVVWLDRRERNPQRRFKLLISTPRPKKNEWQLSLYSSPDGIHWGQPEKTFGPTPGDRCTFFHNPFRDVWVYSLRRYNRADVGRSRYYRESADLPAGLGWEKSGLYLWTNADHLDPRNPDPRLKKVPPELYNLDAVAYESLMLGFFSIWEGDLREPGTPNKRNEVLLGFSRDGFHWHRPDRAAFVAVSEKEDAWNGANVQSAGGGCLVVGDALYFYVSGREKSREDGRNSTGLAVLRRDGFASLDAGEAEGSLVTRPVRFRGKRLFVNLDAPNGQLLAEVLDRQGNVIEPFTKAHCEPTSGDKTLAEVRWKGIEDLSAVAGKPVRFRFSLKKGSLYAFWVSPEASGASHGYVAAGGPGLVGATDTLGQPASSKNSDKTR
ncbi:MAG: hypothetical protein JW809_09600 [Pirellulales bacterium]|nr:hypothetical protein [Pirellulales bacterium]